MNGIRRWLTRLQMPEPGTAPSRLNAYIIRDALVMHAMPQKTWPMNAMIRTVFVQAVVIVLRKTAVRPCRRPR